MAPKRHHRDGPKAAELKELGSYESVIQAFRKYDANGDGKLSWRELHQLMSDLNKGRGFEWREANSDLLLQSIDKDQNGCVDMEELTAYIFPRTDAMGGTAGASDYEVVLENFRRSDANRSGTLDKAEFTRLMQRLKPGWTAAETERVFSMVDKDNSGEIESDELVAWLFGVPADRRRAAKDQRKAARRADAGRLPPISGATPSETLLVIEFVCGGSAETLVNQIKQRWERKMGGQLSVVVKVEGRSSGHTISKVSARNGAVVFWESATMMAYRENPFLNIKTTEEWSKDMLARHIPRLLSGT
jgi:Ca2+-binding EF-hand superfamily protein